MKGMGNDLIREARRRSRLTQTELAALAGTTQSAIARLESGRTSPSFDDVIRLLRLMGLDLDFMLVERDAQDWALATDWMTLTPQERFDRHTRTARQLLALRRAGAAAGATDAA